MAMGWTVRDRNPVVARFSVPVQTGPGAHPAACTMDTGSFPRVKSGRGVTLTSHPLVVPWSRKGRAIRLLPLWAVQPVQSLSACTRGEIYLFTLTPKFYGITVQVCHTISANLNSHTHLLFVTNS